MKLYRVDSQAKSKVVFFIKLFIFIYLFLFNKKIFLCIIPYKQSMIILKDVFLFESIWKAKYHKKFKNAIPTLYCK